jgi:hypothetical protein
VIRNAVIHSANEQPLLADLYALPTPSDAGLLCTNLRMMDGKRPIFIDSTAATFFFPYLVIRFLEIPPGALERHGAETGDLPAGMSAPPAGAAGGIEERLPVAVGAPAEAPEDEPELDLDLDIDEGFLQRVRDI